MNANTINANSAVAAAKLKQRMMSSESNNAAPGAQTGDPSNSGIIRQGTKLTIPKGNSRSVSGGQGTKRKSSSSSHPAGDTGGTKITISRPSLTSSSSTSASTTLNSNKTSKKTSSKKSSLLSANSAAPLGVGVSSGASSKFGSSRNSSSKSGKKTQTREMKLQKKQNAKLQQFLNTRKALELKRAGMVDNVRSLRRTLGTPTPMQLDTTRSRSHWDCLLEEMVWMATDFFEERKFKQAVSVQLAYDAKEKYSEWEAQKQKAAALTEDRNRQIFQRISNECRRFWDAVTGPDQVRYRHSLRYNENSRCGGFGVDDSHVVSMLKSDMETPIEEVLKETNYAATLNEFEKESYSRRWHRASQIVEPPDNMAGWHDLWLPYEGPTSDQEDSTLPKTAASTRKRRRSTTNAPTSPSGVTDGPSEEAEKLEDPDFNLEEVNEEDNESTIAEEERLHSLGDYTGVSEVVQLRTDLLESAVQVAEKLLLQNPQLALRAEEELEDFHGEEEDEAEPSEESTHMDDCEEDGRSVGDIEDMIDDQGTSPFLASTLKEISDMAMTVLEIYSEEDGDETRPFAKAWLAPVLLSEEKLSNLDQFHFSCIRWLVDMYTKRLSSVLADERGLGKEVSVISFLASLAGERKIWGPHLILTTKERSITWELEILSWCPSLRVSRGFCSSNSQICILTFEDVSLDFVYFQRVPWHVVVWDLIGTVSLSTLAENHLPLLRSQWRIFVCEDEKHAQQNAVLLAFGLLPSLFQSVDSAKEWAKKKPNNAWKDCVKHFCFSRSIADVSGISTVSFNTIEHEALPSAQQIEILERITGALQRVKSGVEMTLTTSKSAKGRASKQRDPVDIALSLCLEKVGYLPSLIFPRAVKSTFTMDSVISSFFDESVGLFQDLLAPGPLLSADTAKSMIFFEWDPPVSPPSSFARFSYNEAGSGPKLRRSLRNSETSNQSLENNHESGEIYSTSTSVGQNRASMNVLVSERSKQSVLTRATQHILRIVPGEESWREQFLIDKNMDLHRPGQNRVAVQRACSVLSGFSTPFPDSSEHVPSILIADRAATLRSSGSLQKLVEVVRTFLGTFNAPRERKILVVGFDDVLLDAIEEALGVSKIKFVRLDEVGDEVRAARAFFLANSSTTHVGICSMKELGELSMAGVDLESGLGACSGAVLLDRNLDMENDIKPIEKLIEQIALANHRRTSRRGFEPVEFQLHRIKIHWEEEMEKLGFASALDTTFKPLELGELKSAMRARTRKEQYTSLTALVESNIAKVLGIHLGKREAENRLGVVTLASPNEEENTDDLSEAGKGDEEKSGDEGLVQPNSKLIVCPFETTNVVSIEYLYKGVDSPEDFIILRERRIQSLGQLENEQVSLQESSSIGEESDGESELERFVYRKRDHIFAQDDDDFSSDSSEDEEGYSQTEQTTQKPIPAKRRCFTVSRPSFIRNKSVSTDDADITDIFGVGSIRAFARRFCFDGELIVIDTKRLPPGYKDESSSKTTSVEGTAVSGFNGWPSEEQASPLSSQRNGIDSESLFDEDWFQDSMYNGQLFFSLDLTTETRDSSFRTLLKELDEDPNTFGRSYHIYGPPNPDIADMEGFETTLTPGLSLPGTLPGMHNSFQQPKFVVNFMSERVVEIENDFTPYNGHLEDMQQALGILSRASSSGDTGLAGALGNKRNSSVDLDDERKKKQKLEKKKSGSISGSTSQGEFQELFGVIEEESMLRPTKVNNGKEVDWQIQVPKLRKSNVKKEKGQNDILNWTKWEDAAILRAVEVYGPNWDFVASLVSSPFGIPRTNTQVMERYYVVRSENKSAGSCPWVSERGGEVKDISSWASPPLHVTDLLLNVPPNPSAPGAANQNISNSEALSQNVFPSAESYGKRLPMPHPSEGERDGALSAFSLILASSRQPAKTILPESEFVPPNARRIHPSQTSRLGHGADKVVSFVKAFIEKQLGDPAARARLASGGGGAIGRSLSASSGTSTNNSRSSNSARRSASSAPHSSRSSTSYQGHPGQQGMQMDTGSYAMQPGGGNISHTSPHATLQPQAASPHYSQAPHGTMQPMQSSQYHGHPGHSSSGHSPRESAPPMMQMIPSHNTHQQGYAQSQMVGGQSTEMHHYGGRSPTSSMGYGGAHQPSGHRSGHHYGQPSPVGHGMPNYHPQQQAPPPHGSPVPPQRHPSHQQPHGQHPVPPHHQMSSQPMHRNQVHDQSQQSQYTGQHDQYSANAQHQQSHHHSDYME